MREVKLPEVTKEEAEATLMVLFTTPLKRLGLVDTHIKINKLELQQEHHTQKECQVEKSTIVLGENVISVCMPVCTCVIVARRGSTRTTSLCVNKG